MRYFIGSLNQVFELEQKMRKKEVDAVFQVVVRESSHTKRVTWHLLELDVEFKRKPLGSGVTIFYVNINNKFFME